jgi:hypothetical protein
MLNARALQYDALEVVINAYERAIGPRPPHDTRAKDAARPWVRWMLDCLRDRPGNTLCRNPGEVGHLVRSFWGCEQCTFVEALAFTVFVAAAPVIAGVDGFLAQDDRKLGRFASPA